MSAAGRPGSRRAAHRERAEARLRRTADVPAASGGVPVPAPRTPAPPGPVLVRWTLPPVLAAVPEVRHRLRDLLHGWRVDDELTDTLLLAATELVSNSVRHAAVLTEQVRVTCAIAPGRIRLDVSDDHPFRPRALMDTGMDAEDGRGLFIVKLTIAEANGVIDVLASEAGKTIRIHVPVPL